MASFTFRRSSKEWGARWRRALCALAWECWSWPVATKLRSRPRARGEVILSQARVSCQAWRATGRNKILLLRRLRGSRSSLCSFCGPTPDRPVLLAVQDRVLEDPP